MSYTSTEQTVIKRVLLVVLDGVGAGELPDAAQYGDVGSNTLGHTAIAVGGLALPTMGRLGLGNITPIAGVPPMALSIGCYGKMHEASPGKDTITGHWEMAGVILRHPFPTYPHGFPPYVIAAFEHEISTKTLGNVAASGTDIIERLGAEHVRTGFPIVYTSADSVFQIAMHEAVIPIERQYEICEIARLLLTGVNQVGRVICRPFVDAPHSEAPTSNTPGSASPANAEPTAAARTPAQQFKRTERRRDYPVDAPPTVLDDFHTAGLDVHAIGKINEIFNGRGITTWDHTTNNADHTAALLRAAQSNDSPLIFANLEDFDMLYAHRNDPQGLACALETWDTALPSILAALRSGDLLMITADHGNDPTTASTDHSREYPFLLAYGPSLRSGIDLGIRQTFADIAATLREGFHLPAGENGTSFLSSLTG